MKRRTPAQEAKRKKVAQKRADYTKKREQLKKIVAAERHIQNKIKNDTETR